MISYDFDSYCCGCGACGTICPVNAISMEQDDNGFTYPHVNTDKCIECNMCVNVCPHINAQSHVISAEQKRKVSTNLYSSKQSICKEKSSSGGAFYEMAVSIIQEEGCVCGCAWDDNLIAKHIMVDNLKDLQRLQGSKYVQSVVDSSLYTMIIARLKAGRKVLFSGTPCQCEAVSLYVKNKNEKLLKNIFTVAVICHGVSAPIVWESFKKWIQKKENDILVDVNFRDKSKEGYKKSYCCYKFKNKTVYLPTYLPSSPYIEATLVYNLALRKSCVNCDCKGYLDNIDVIIGDHYAANKGEGEYGTSCVLGISEKGRNLCEHSLFNCRYIELLQIEKANPLMLRSIRKSNNRDSFLRDLHNIGTSIWDNIERYYPSKYKLKKIICKLGVYDILKKL